MLFLLSYWKYIALALLLASLVGYFYYSQNRIESLIERNVILKIQVLESEEAVRVLEANTVRQREAVSKLMITNQEANKELSRYLGIFDKHNLNKLARAKPGLIEKRVNEGSIAVLKDLENETSTNSD